MTAADFFAAVTDSGARKLLITRDGQRYVALAETIDHGRPPGRSAGSAALARLPEDVQ